MTEPPDPPGDAHARARPIRSYVLREGRFTDAQRRAFADLWPRYGISWPGDAPLDLPSLFGDQRPLYAEIGFGNGEALASMAARHPEHDYLGIEVHRPGIGRLLQRLAREGLDNVRLLRHDAVEVLAQALPEASLAGLYVLFPDPWPKTRHHKRRLIQPPFLALAARVLAPGGRLHLATDWADYAQWMLTLLEQTPQFQNRVPGGGFAPRPVERPLTHFERRGQGLGHGVWDLRFERRP